MFKVFESCGSVLAGVRLAAVAIGLAGVGTGGTSQTLPPEVKVGTAAIIDHEFDWGRDGVHCPTCNLGAGNARFAYIDKDNKLWVGQVDFQTGFFYPPDGKGTLVDSNATAPGEIGNGPEWMFSARGSEIVYTRWTDGMPKNVTNLNMGFARMGGGGWIGGSVTDSALRMMPIGTMDLEDEVPSVHYQNVAVGNVVANLYWRDVLPNAPETKLPLSTNDPGMTRRWLPGTRDMLITAPALNSATGRVVKQVFIYRTASAQLEQLTFDMSDKLWAFPWKAPEYGNEVVFSAVVGGNKLNIYRYMAVGRNPPKWRVSKTIAMPLATPYINSPEPFVHNGRSWVFFTLSSNPDLHAYTSSLIAMTGIEPATNTLTMLSSENDPPRSRRDPEYFITANGPYIYYNRYLLETPTTPVVNEGIFRVDTGLGPRQQ